MYIHIKNLFDRLLAFFGLLILSIPLLIVAIVIAIDSKGPVIFMQKRVGKNFEPFFIYKFRTMTSTKVEFDIDNPVIEEHNQNLTKVGKFIRKFKIDELLQLVNVLKGDMSLIGPRPLMPIYVQKYDLWEKQKFLVKPGMTGLSQVSGNGHLSIEERSFYDVEYVKNLSLMNDIKILFKTVAVVLRGEEKYIKYVDQEDFEQVKSNIDKAISKFENVVIEDENKYVA